MAGDPLSFPVFVDWITVAERHPQGGLPIVCKGVHSWSDSQGVCRAERISSTNLCGSHSTSVLLGSDGASVFLAGNVGRLSRQDNVFNLGWQATIEKSNRILVANGLPEFSVTRSNAGEKSSYGARLLRVDITCGFSSGSDAQARALIRWAQGLSVARMTRGYKGDWGVYWVNTRRMVKAYLKAPEMVEHGMSPDEWLVTWTRDQGMVRLEVEVKRRELQALGLNFLGDVTDEKLRAIFAEETAFLRKVDRSDEPDILMAIPSRSRPYAAAWLKGQDLRQICSNGTFYRHAKVLRGFGIDITQRRDIHNFPVKVRVVDLVPLSPPSWYEWDEAA